MSTVVPRPMRWTMADIARFYDDGRITLARRRGVVFTAFAFLLLTLIAPRLYFLWLVVILGVEAFVDSTARAPLRSRKQYEDLRASWLENLNDSSPDATMEPTVPLQEGERVIYTDPSTRYIERHLGTRSTPVAAANTVARATPGSPPSTTEQIYGEVPVDEGELTITDRRVVFLGKRDTLEIPLAKIYRYSYLQWPDRLVLEYPGRPSGESYTIDMLFFQLCMYRRSPMSTFSMPKPPPPLPEDTDLAMVTRSHAALAEST